MEKYVLKKFFVAIVMAMASTGVHAEVRPFNEYFSSESVTDGWMTNSVGRYTPVIMSENDDYFLTVDQSQRSGNSTMVTGTILSGKAAIDDFTLTFDMRLGSSGGGQYAQYPTAFSIMDATNSEIFFSLVAKGPATGITGPGWKINNTEIEVDLPKSGYTYSGISQITWCSYKLSRWHGLTFLTITNRETGEEIFARQPVNGSSAKGGLGNIVFDAKRYRSNFAIDNIVLRPVEGTDIPNVTPTTYTVHYRNTANIKIKADTTIVSYVGAKVAATTELMAPIIYNGQKYLYQSGNDSIAMSDNSASNVITLVYREAVTYNYTVNATDINGKILRSIAQSTGFENDELSVPYCTYMVNDGLLLSHLLDYKQYVDVFILDTDNLIRNIAYKSTGINNVVFYAEAEDVEGMIPYSAGNAYLRSSQCAMGYAKTDVKFTTLEPGNYQLTSVRTHLNSMRR